MPHLVIGRVGIEPRRAHWVIKDRVTFPRALWFANTRPPVPPVDFVVECATGSRMLTALVVLLRSIGLICRGHRAVALENLALRQQLVALTRTVKRPQLRRRDRLFGSCSPRGGASGAPP
jgi:hypothetical protein